MGLGKEWQIQLDIVGILAEIGLNQLKPVYCLDVSKVKSTSRVEAEHFDYFLLEVVRLVFGLLRDQIVNNVEQKLSQFDHVTSLLFLRVGDKVSKGHQIVRVHTFGNEYFDCLEFGHCASHSATTR
ncbi:hypothetical protein BpHYR1_048222 [Brachionus plicatilis]|uniref:Uncharacterized protein n=1 Tax=Brachionus plicatilis TaxID=10195 RepID=A0A3M7P324_BRAPC|nr:hypothetical protein BpHYR1_048222 [Brachionus plicatilis]